MSLKIINKKIGCRSRWRITALLSVLMCLSCHVGGGCYAAPQPDLMVRLASEGDGSFVGESIYDAEVQVKAQGAALGLGVSYVVRVKNAGDAADRFVITGGGSGNGFAVAYRDEGGVDVDLAGAGVTTALLAPGASTVFTLTVTPSLLPLALNFEVRINGASVADGTKRDGVKTETCASGNVAAVTVSTPEDLTAPSGTVVTYAYSVTNTGNTPNAFALAAGGDWPGILYADAGAGGRQAGEGAVTASTGLLAPGGSYRLFLDVAIPAASANGARGNHLLTVTGTGASVSDRVTTTAVAPQLSLVDSVRNVTRGGVFAPTVEASPGDTLEYRLALTNVGGAGATGVALTNEVPAHTELVPDSLVVATTPRSDGGGCAAASCGQGRASAGTIAAYLGEGATASAGGTLPVGMTVYLFFRTQLQ